MDTILYTAQLVVGLGILAAASAALLILIEGIWWIYAKATGREY